MKPGILLWIQESEGKIEQLSTIQTLGLEIRAVLKSANLLDALRTKRPSVIVYDCNLPEARDLENLKALLQEDAECKVIVLVSASGVELAMKGFDFGVYQVLQKPVHSKHLLTTIQNAAKAHQAARENDQLREIVQDESQQEYILGNSAAMSKVWDTVRKIAPSDVPVLIEGETGSGKEVVARAIYQNSLRNQDPFVVMNCAALSKELIESDLFGHVRGAFTGAIETKKGRFETADGGTLFLDELGEIPLDLQPKLLRVLQNKTFQRVGDPVMRQVDVRIIAATNRNLKEAVETKAFREDLYYRLNVVHIYVPPLRERREELAGLVEFFIALITTRQGQERLTLSPEAENFMLNYPFPGNIRELKNMLERASLMCTENMINLDDLLTPMSFKRHQEPSGKDLTHAGSPKATNFSEAKTEFELYHLIRLLTQAKGNVSLAARLAGIHRNNFKQKMKKFGLESIHFRD